MSHTNRRPPGLSPGSNVFPDDSGQTRPLTPEERQRTPFEGLPVTMLGAPWKLPEAYLMAALDRPRDRLYDNSTWDGKVDYADVMESAFVLLSAAYSLTAEETVALLRSADEDELTNAVLVVLFGLAEPHRTYTDWMRTALVSNGIDPATIPAALVPGVLRHLVVTGRAEPADTYVTVLVAAGRRARLPRIPSRNGNVTDPESPEPTDQPNQPEA